MEAPNQGIMFEHLGENPKDQSPAGPLAILQVLQQNSQDRPEVLEDVGGGPGPDDPDDAGHGLSSLSSSSSHLDTLQRGDEFVQLSFAYVRIWTSSFPCKSKTI